MSELEGKAGGMGVEPHVDGEGALVLSGDRTASSPDAPARRRPNVSGDLPTVFETAPMFRRTLAGYDRFQVDSYVQWAEEELATADREREHLTGRYLRTVAELAEARELLSHSSSGAELLQLSRRLGTLLATAADEADGMLADADGDRRTAAAQVEQAAAEAQLMAERAAAQAELTTAAAASEAAGLLAEARRFVEEAEATRTQAHAEAEEGHARILDLEQRAQEQAEQVRSRAASEATAARLQGRAEVLAMLTTARAERQRADAEAARIREAQDEAAAARRSFLLADVAALEDRRNALRAEIDGLARQLTGATVDAPGLRLHAVLAWLGWPPRSAPVRNPVSLPKR
ncbi:hypothetical protein [Candidatus Blastococcus massiliensis]|uniref:hypothetical protein n=1 Tax=Candidatus Blastococcus massiliensis TaxID=1470358 RepID=UPI000590ED32|nr:hypothetical protein [Candidatus Blastococcus massiliensis]